MLHERKLRCPGEVSPEPCCSSEAANALHNLPSLCNVSALCDTVSPEDCLLRHGQTRTSPNGQKNQVWGGPLSSSADIGAR